MSPITHFLASWTLADGLGVLVDAANKVLGRPDSWYFGESRVPLSVPQDICGLRVVADEKPADVHLSWSGGTPPFEDTRHRLTTRSYVVRLMDRSS